MEKTVIVIIFSLEISRLINVGFRKKSLYFLTKVLFLSTNKTKDMAVILTYNVNGVRAALKKDFNGWLKATNADVICLQEIKANVEQFDESVFTDLGYNCYWNSAEKKGYSGVAILTKQKPKHIEYGCGIKDIDFEGRFIRVDFENYSVMSIYFPSGSSGEVRQEFKIYFLDKFQTYIDELKQTIPNLVLCGDYNICHQAIDIQNPNKK